MRIADYRKRAAKAAEKWKRLQAQEQAKKNAFLTEDLPIDEFQSSESESNLKPVITVQGIKVSSKKQKEKTPHKLRDTA